MTTEEKAIAYEQALKRAKKLHKDAIDMEENLLAKQCEIIFPEIAESEDERIRKFIVEQLFKLKEKVVFDSNRDRELTSAIAWLEKQVSPDVVADAYLRGCNDTEGKWLEKQGGQKPTLPKWKYKKDNTPLLRDSIILNKYGCVAKSPSGAIVSDVWVIDYDELAKLPKEELEKQGEKEFVLKSSKSDKPKPQRMVSAEAKEALYDKPAEWSYEDERMCQETIDWFEKKCFPYALEDENPARESIKWIRTLKDRVPQRPKQEWSEEDEKHFTKCLELLIAQTETISIEEIHKNWLPTIDWLKSLSPQNRWKPSEEQMRALHDMNLTGNISYAKQAQALIELYNDLKKLTE